MKRDVLLTILMWALLLAPFLIVVIDGASSRSIALAVALLFAYIYACSRFVGTKLCPRWLARFITSAR
jgi:hypothetical protein